MTEKLIEDLIVELDDRSHVFHSNAEVCNGQYMASYWEGKLSESQFVIEKLKQILYGE